MSVLHVLFRVGDSEYAIAASDVLFMESFTQATRVPGAPSYVAGIVQIRGRVFPVVDLRARFGLPPLERSPDARIVVVQSGKRAVGLLVDAAREVLKLDPEQFREPPEIVTAQSGGYVRAVIQSAARLIMLLDFNTVIGSTPEAAGEAHHA